MILLTKYIVTGNLTVDGSEFWANMFMSIYAYLLYVNVTGFSPVISQKEVLM